LECRVASVQFPDGVSKGASEMSDEQMDAAVGATTEAPPAEAPAAPAAPAEAPAAPTEEPAPATAA